NRAGHFGLAEPPADHGADGRGPGGGDGPQQLLAGRRDPDDRRPGAARHRAAGPEPAGPPPAVPAAHAATPAEPEAGVRPLAPPASRGRARPLFHSVRGSKIAEHQSPQPQARFFYSFNFFSDVNQKVNKAIGAPVNNLRVYREIFGLEKTFDDGFGSIGFRLPL